MLPGICQQFERPFIACLWSDSRVKTRDCFYVVVQDVRLGYQHLAQRCGVPLKIGNENLSDYARYATPQSKDCFPENLGSAIV